MTMTELDPKSEFKIGDWVRFIPPGGGEEIVFKVDDMNPTLLYRLYDSEGFDRKRCIPLGIDVDALIRDKLISLEK